MTKLRGIQKRRGFRVAIIFALACVAVAVVGKTVVAGDAPLFTGLRNEQQIRADSQTQFREIHSDRTGRYRPDLLHKGIAQAQRLSISSTWRSADSVKASALANPSSASASSAITGAQWVQYGPEPLRIDAEQNFQGTGPDAGMITELAIDPRGTTDQVIYQSNNDGGIWKTTDGGATWTPMTDFMPSNSMGAVTLDAGNPSIVYAGTGNLFNNGYFNPTGVYRSVDAGQTWTNVAKAVFGTRGINRMTSPAANVLLVATNNGLFKSVDGGTNFGTAPSFTNGSPVLGGNISDLHLDTTTANAVLASVNGSGIRQSTDGGSTWGANLFTATNGAPTANFNFISFAQSTSPNNQTVYASVGGGTACPATGSPPNGCNYNNLYVSTDGGANWTAQGTGGSSAFAAATKCQCGYDQTIGVDPADANKVYIGFQRLFYSSNGGAGPFNAVSDNKIHWDEHAIVFSPPTHPSLGPETRVWVGNDGGVARSDDAGSTWANLNETVSTNLFRGLDIGRGSPTNNIYAYTGTQDTGTIGHRPGDSGRDWHLGIDGDGNLVAVDWCDPQHVVGTDNGGYSQTSNGGNTWGGGGGFPAGTSLANPAFDPRCADRTPGNRIVYFGGTTNLGDGPPATIQINLFRSSDNGGSYSIMKQFASSNAGGLARITAIATSPLDSNVVWVGFSDGTIQRTADALQGSSATWTAVAVTGSPGQAIGEIALDPSNTQVAVATYEGFTSTNPATTRTKHVFRTTDNGSTWTDVSGLAGGGVANYPDLPTHSVVIDPGTSPHSIIVSNDAGVMRSLDNGQTWQRLGVGLPTVDSTQLALDYGSDPPVLRVGTYGRSSFELSAPTGPVLAVNTDLGFGNVGVGQRASRIVQVFNVGTSDLHISGISRLSGDPAFTIFPTPPTPTTIQPGEELDFTIQFAPTVRGNLTAIFHIQSDDPTQPDYQLPASGTGVTGKIAVSGSLDFGTVARGTTATREITVTNTGLAALTISNVFRSSGDSAFTVLPNPGVPQTLQPSDSIVYTVQFAPPATSNGNLRTAVIRIASDDPDNPTVDLNASGIPGVPHGSLDTSAIDFGGVPVDNRTTPHQIDRTVTITNQSSCILCDLTITSLVFSGANPGDFSVVGAPSTPFTIGAGNHIELTVRFNPPLGGARSATLTINSDDPANPSQAVALSGEGLLPAITAAPAAMIFGPTVYDPNCGIFCGQTQTEVFTNTGQAELIADLVGFTGSPAFSGPGASSPPDRFAQGTSLSEPVTFRPTAPARKLTGTLTLRDNLPFDGVPVGTLTVERQVPLCGEAVGRGIRVLVEDNAGNPVTTPIDLRLHSVGTSPNVNVNIKNLTLQTINPPTSCQTIRFQYENQKLPATEQDHPSSSYYTLDVSAGGNRSATITFVLAPNGFREIVMTIDTIPPTIFAPTVISTTTKSGKGRIVSFRIRAKDNRDGKVGVLCSPRSGSFFALGRTRVTCRAHDRAGNKAVKRFIVRVKHRK
jgi:Abnormal spindle-like microcephaly-assoc'd, ASPM-SPD-2-Hydin/HYR domain